MGHSWANNREMTHFTSFICYKVQLKSYLLFPWIMLWCVNALLVTCCLISRPANWHYRCSKRKDETFTFQSERRNWQKSLFGRVTFGRRLAADKLHPTLKAAQVAAARSRYKKLWSVQTLHSSLGSEQEVTQTLPVLWMIRQPHIRVCWDVQMIPYTLLVECLDAVRHTPRCPLCRNECRVAPDETRPRTKTTAARPLSFYHLMRLDTTKLTLSTQISGISSYFQL